MLTIEQRRGLVRLIEGYAVAGTVPADRSTFIRAQLSLYAYINELTDWSPAKAVSA